MDYYGFITTDSKTTVNKEFKFFVKNINLQIDAIKDELKKGSSQSEYIFEKLNNISIVLTKFRNVIQDNTYEGSSGEDSSKEESD